ncbi:hypothetical protein S-CBS2_gp091 [Synechococcus phage S-CBS2]|nr:hypothetical protein S-CBS2_gp091 [Synechococcus phage S-CBS2]ADF42447.1 hypothetical protein S-CBS2_gp091 [Synechococcus phage S-CBS2]
MTQLEYYTTILKSIVLLLAWTGGVTAIGIFGVLTYYFYPWVKK